MSLNSNGSTFSITVPLGPVFEKAKEYSGLTFPAKDLKTSFVENHLTASNTVEGKRKAFLELMQAFANSAEFEALTYDLENRFIVNVQHSCNLTMPKPYDN
jgi:hypothetical protein